MYEICLHSSRIANVTPPVPGLQVRRLADYVMKDLGGNEFIESLGTWCARNPHLAICLLAAGLAFLIPF